jgi:hypothetical protein
MIKISKAMAEYVNNHGSKIITASGIIGAVISARMSVNRDPNHMMLMYRITGDEQYYVKYLRMTKSNNWLRMHGYAMRTRKRKH